MRKLFNKDFLLFVQGKFISNFGDVLHSVALSYWVLETTGSKTLMGTLLATQTLVKVLLGPVAGVLCDRVDRKKTMVLSDLLSGITIIVVSILGFMGKLNMAILFIASMLLAVIASIFNPTMQSILPDLVEEEDLSRAISINQSATTLVQIVVQSMSGVILSLFGPLYIFLGNGISYVLSGVSESFIIVPRINKQTKLTFFEDFKSGLDFVNDHVPLKTTIFIGCLINFLANGAFVLLLPYFLENSILKGASGYGFFSSLLTAGALVASIFYSLFKVKEDKRIYAFQIGIFIQTFGIVLFVFTKNYAFVLIAAFLFGLGNAIFNIIYNQMLYKIVPIENRGKVFSLLSTFSMGLTPLSMALFSVLADLLSTEVIIKFGFISGGLMCLLLIFIKNTRKLFD